MLTIKFNKEINELFKIFKKNNKELYLVGGAVRDSIIGLIPSDYDFSTNALPQEVISMFTTVIPTGIDYGTVTVVLNKQEFEITTYRKDHDYDSRRPKSISFSTNISEDLKRRDFTINAMAMNQKGDIVDLFGGIDDIKNKIIRFVGNPEERVIEDRLRLLRGIRFSTVYDFNIEEAQYREIFLKASDMDFSKISEERFVKEFNKILCSKNVKKGINLLKNTGLLVKFIPEFEDTFEFNQQNPYHIETVFNHLITVTENIENDLILRLSALFHDIGKPSTFTLDEKGIGHFYGHETKSVEIIKIILRRLKYSNKIINKVTHLVENHMLKQYDMKSPGIRRFIKKIGDKDQLHNLQKLQLADSPANTKEINQFYNRVFTILSLKEPMEITSLAINGRDLMNTLKLNPGKQIGAILDYLMEKILDDPRLNQKEPLLNLAELFIGGYK